MFYYLFYKYKPADTIAYFFGFLGVLLTISRLEMTAYPLQSGSLFIALFFRIMAFTIWYPSFLCYFYVLKDSDNIKIQGISLSCLKPAMKLYFFLNLALFSFFILIFTLFFHNYADVSHATSIGMFGLSIFGIKKFENFLADTLISQGEKEHVDTKNISADYLYEATREVLSKQPTS